MSKGIGLMSIFGPERPEGDDKSPKDMACKALWKATKRDDYEAFKEALEDFLRYREREGKEDSDGNDDQDD